MKILVFSDSHGSLAFMRQAMEAVQPDVWMHLGDHYWDGEALAEQFPHTRHYQVDGNCDRSRVPFGVRSVLRPRLCGVEILMTHGHLHGVKQGLGGLLSEARAVGAQLVLYGHTHIPQCLQTEDGLWVLNPGSCGYLGDTAGLVELEDGQVQSCRILTGEDLRNLARQD